MRTIYYLFLVVILTCCKKDKIDLTTPLGFGGERHLIGFSFIFYEKDTEYSLAFETTESSKHLNFKEVVNTFVRKPLGNKGVFNFKKSRGSVEIGIDNKSIRVDKEEHLKVTIYKNGKVIDTKRIDFTVALDKSHKDKSIEKAGYLKKKCISNWQNTKFYASNVVIDGVFLGKGYSLTFEYPQKPYTDEELKALKKQYDDCYVEGSDADKY